MTRKNEKAKRRRVEKALRQSEHQWQSTFHTMTEEVLRESEERFRTVIEASPDAIGVVDLEGRILLANRAAAALTGFDSVEDLLSSRINGFDLLVPEDRQRARDNIARLIATGVVREVEYTALRQDGSRRPVEVSASLQRDLQGHPQAAVLVLRDITERKRAEEALCKAKQAAEAANRAKSEFLANMSHEIRTPMTAILGFADLLMAPHLSLQEQHECLQTIRRNGKALLDLINDILDLSRIEADRLTLEKTDYPLRQVLDDVLSVVRVRAEQKGLSLRVDDRGPLPQSIHTDPVRLRQILVNLLGNAIKFTERGEVRLALRWLREAPGGPRMQFAVSDTGIGIAPEKLGELFQPFTQADASLTRRYGGTGLGLAISQRLAKALGGDIEVRSALGQGSTFTLTVSAGPLQGVRLRRGPPAPAPASEEPSPGEPEVRLRGRVLLVEDVPDLHHMLRQMLGKMGLEVEIAENGRRACQMAQHSQAEARPYDLILMDIQMPEMNGFEATRWLREHGWQGAIVALTAHAMVGDREKCLAAGCDEYLSKPVNAAGLEAIVARYLGREETAADACPAAAQAGAEPAGPLGGGLLDPAAAAELLAAFAGELPGRVKCMEDALREGDLPRLQALAHQLKGTAGVYGFPRLSEAAEVVHQRATEEDDVQRLHAAVAELAALCAEAAAAR